MNEQQNASIKMYFSTSDKRWELFEERNMIVEDMDEYLETKECIERSIVQYQKLSLDMSLKIDLGQEFSKPLFEPAIKYVRIEMISDITSQVYYYYVRQCEWLSRSAVRLVLRMDTLNTFKYNDYEHGYELSPYTHITRQHRDRVKLCSKYQASIKSGSVWGMNTLKQLYGTNSVFNVSEAYDIVSLVINDTKIIPDSGKLYLSGSQVYETYTFDGYIVSRFLTTRHIGTVPDNPSGTVTFKCIVVDGTYWNISGSVVSDFEQVGSYIVGEIVFTFDSEPSSNLCDKLSTATRVNVYTGTSLTGTQYEFIIPSFCDYEYRGGTSKVYTEEFYGGTISFITSSRINVEIEQISEIVIVFNGEEVTLVYTLYSSYLEGILGDSLAIRDIDYYPENLQLPLYKTDEEYVYDSLDNNVANDNWYVLFTNQEDETASLNRPALMFLVPETNNWTMATQGTSNFINTSTLPNTGEYGSENKYAFCLKGKGKVQFFYMVSDTTMQSIPLLMEGDSLTGVNNGELYMIEVRITSYVYSDLNVVVGMNIAYRYTYNNGGTKATTDESYLSDIRLIEWDAGVSVTYADIGSSSSFPSSYSLTWNTGSELSFIFGFSTINRTDTRIIKLIEIPYSPLSYTDNSFMNAEEDGGNLMKIDFASASSTGSDITYYGLEIYEADLTREITTRTDNPLLEGYVNLSELPVDAKFDKSGELSSKLESKLFHSDFHYKKAVYDSFNFSYHLEMIDFSGFFNSYFTFKYTISKTTNSTFLFEFDDVAWKYADEDYPNALVVSRNNQITLFSNEYLTYLRSGYNYDVKIKNLQLASDIFGSVTTMFGGGTRAYGLNQEYGGANGDPGVITMGRGSIATSMLNSIGGTVFGGIIRNLQLEKKKAEKQYQTTSVYGSDDVDLMNEYAKNKMKMVTYDIPDRMKQLVLSLFHYTGYVCNEYGIPDVTTRTRFNFVMADIVFETMLNLSEQIRQDLRNRWAGGVYFIHHYNDTWDIKLEYENYEISLEEIIVKE